MIRTFIALPIPENLKEALRDAISRLRRTNSKVKWVRPESVHITLKFLGNIKEELVEPVSAELDNVALIYPELDLGLSGLGVFPGMRRPRVIWVGLGGDITPLGEMADAIDKVCAKFGIQREKRPFNAHVTLGRLKVPSMVDLDINLMEESFRAQEVVFYKSELLPSGARYTILHSSSLGHKGE
jgi:2'-5' RNA ligase